MQARTMYDSTSASDIPTSAEMVAGYVDGAYRWSAADWARFPGAVHVTIATQPSTDDGHVLDVELGDATPPQAPNWIRMRQAAGLVQPTIYCGLSAVGQIQQYCSGLLYWLWIADWTGEPHPLSYAAAVQYADSRQSGGHYDLSVVYSEQWPDPHVPPVTGESDDMTLPMAQLIVWSWYPAILRRTPIAQSEVDGWAVQLVAPGANFEQVATAFCATPEAQAALSKGT